MPPAPPPPPPATRPVVTSRAVVHRPADKPDFLLITASNLPLRNTGFGGNTTVKTPNLDKLASEGVLFTRFYTTTPQPAPARASLLTGRYPHHWDVTTEGPEPRSLPPETDTFTGRLAEAGYRCAIIGPWDFEGAVAVKPVFGFVDYPAVTGQPWDWTHCDVWIEGRQTKADSFLPDWTADRAIEYLARGGDQPTFLWVSFHAPNLPKIYPPDGQNLYPPEAITLPLTYTTSLPDRPSILAQTTAARDDQYAGEKGIREAWSRHFAMLTHLDRQIGLLLESLDKLGLRERTVVVFLSESGCALGDHQLLGTPPSLYEEMVRCPLIIAPPGTGPRNAKVNRVTSLIDLAPTLLAMAGLETPVTLEGRSLTPLMADPGSDGHLGECFLELGRQQNLNCEARGIIVGNFKYMDYATGTDAFFDLGRDPEETHGLLQDPQYAGVLNVLKTRLQQWQQATRDPLLHR